MVGQPEQALSANSNEYFSTGNGFVSGDCGH